MLTRFFAVSSAVAFLTASQVDAHGHLVLPKADFGSNKAMMSSFAGRIPDPNTIFTGANFPGSGTKGNYKEFLTHFKAGKQSLKEIIDANNKPLSGATKECGFTVLGAAQDAPAVMNWGKNEGTAKEEGFRPSHLGACETYCDSTLVQKSDECATSYNQPNDKGLAKVPIDSSKCVGAKQLTFYWLSTQAKDEGGFQVYINCIALSGSAGKSSGNSTAVANDADSSTPASVKPSKASDGSEKTQKSKKPKASKSDSSESASGDKKEKKKDHKKSKGDSSDKKEHKSKKDESSNETDADADTNGSDEDCN